MIDLASDCDAREVPVFLATVFDEAPNAYASRTLKFLHKTESYRRYSDTGVSPDYRLCRARLPSCKPSLWIRHSAQVAAGVRRGQYLSTRQVPAAS